MKVLLLRPARIKQAITLGEFMYSEPIGLEMIYTMLDDNHQVEILDLMSEYIMLEDKLREFKPQVVGITSLCIDVHAVLELAKRIKEYDQHIVTIVGGTQAYLDSKAFFTNDVDHIFKYTTTSNINKLFEYIERHGNEKQKRPVLDGIYSKINGFKGTSLSGMNEYVHPNRKSTSKYRKHYSYFGYKPCAIMGTAQGCSKTCHFCLRWRIEGFVETYFPMDFVKEEIRSIEENNIMIFDNDFLHSEGRLKEFCNFLEEESIEKTFICYGSVHSILRNKDIIKRFHRLGLRAVLVGYETFKEDELIKYQKKSSLPDNVEAARILKEIGLDVWASFILHPDWSRKDFRTFRKYIKILKPQISTFSPLTPFANLPLYDEYKDRLLVGKEDYDQWSFGQVTIRPSQMSLVRYYLEILKTIIYVNIFRNNIIYIINKFGLVTVFRLFKGSAGSLIKYIKLGLRDYKIEKTD